MSNWWLVSWTTYGTWLPGDPRGYCTWRGKEYVPPPQRYANRGEVTYSPLEHSDIHRLAQQISGEPVYFTFKQIEIALGALIAEIAEMPIVPAIISLGPWHVHWLCHFGKLRIRRVVGRVKAAATRELHAASFAAERPWAKGCNMR